MKPTRPRPTLPVLWLFQALLIAQAALLTSVAHADEAAATAPWPPALPGANAQGTLTIHTDAVLAVPESVKTAMEKEGFAPFTVAKVAPVIDLAYHRDLPDPALNGTGWSSWGDIWVARNAKVYSGVGDHGNDVGGKAHVFIYEWDPQTKVLKQIMDPNQHPPRSAGDVTFAKVHAGIQETVDGKILVITTLNDGGTAGQVKWSDNVPGSPILAYDPATGQTERLFSLPARCSATTIMDPQRNLLFLCLEGNDDKESRGSALAAFDPVKRELVYRSPDGAVVANRDIAIDRDGNVYFNGQGGQLWKYDAANRSIAPSGMAFPKVGERQPTMRASTHQSRDGWIYGATMDPGQLFRFHPQSKKVEILGPDFGTGDYTTVAVLSPDDRFVYLLPGAHNSAMHVGTPVVQYEIATGQRKVLAFLRDYCEQNLDYVPAGTYGIKLSEDGSVLYVNFNGHGTEKVRVGNMTASGFGLTSFAAIHIPQEER